MTTKELFVQDKELSKQVSAIAPTTWFSQWLMYAMGQVMEASVTTEEISGAKKFRDALLSLADDPEASRPALTSGIKHDLTIPARTSFSVSQKPAVKQTATAK